MKFFEKTRTYLKEKPTRLTQIIILLTGLVLVSSYLIFFKASMENVRETAIFLRLGIAETSQTEIENFINENITALTELTNKLDYTGDEKEKKELIEKLMREKSWLTNISIADKNGNETIRSSKYSISDSGNLENISDSEEFQMAIMGELFLCKVHTDEKSIPILNIALPIGESGSGSSGVIIAQLSLQKIWDIISSSKLVTTDQKIYVVDSEGFLISHPDTSSVLKKTNLLEKSFVNEVITGRNIVKGEQYIDSDNKSMLVVGVPMEKKLGWGIFVEESSQSALAAYNQIRNASIIFIFLTFALLLILIINSQTLANVFSDFKEGVRKRTRELEELDKTTKLLIRRDLELSEANNRLEELDDVKSDFVSIAAHQLRTPLTGIKWSFIALKEKEAGPLNSEQSKIIENGLEAINHTIVLINDLLNVAHIEEGKFGFNFKSTAILPLIQKAFERFAPLAGEKGVWLEANLTKDTLPLISLDPEKISLVMDNLLDNAIKYTSPGGKIKLELAYENSGIKITVSDTGIGIPKGQFDRVFTKFFRGENALLFQTSGSGLGLYMIKNIIDRHCGTISVRSEENKGTIFVITLPETCKV
jgi:signal transduction histidine kinase